MRSRSSPTTWRPGRRRPAADTSASSPTAPTGGASACPAPRRRARRARTRPTGSGIAGVVEADFFDWVVHVPGGEPFVRSLARRVGRFRWQEVGGDVLKVLYESVITTETRKRLGEYYTPDWLAERIVATTIDRPLETRLPDRSCG